MKLFISQITENSHKWPQFLAFSAIWSQHLIQLQYVVVFAKVSLSLASSTIPSTKEVKTLTALWCLRVFRLIKGEPTVIQRSRRPCHYHYQTFCHQGLTTITGDPSSSIKSYDCCWLWGKLANQLISAVMRPDGRRLTVSNQGNIHQLTSNGRFQNIYVCIKKQMCPPIFCKDKMPETQVMTEVIHIFVLQVKIEREKETERREGVREAVTTKAINENKSLNSLMPLNRPHSWYVPAFAMLCVLSPAAIVAINITYHTNWLLSWEQRREKERE